MMPAKNDVQFDSSDLILDGVNTTEAIQTEGDIYFNESYVMIGKKVSAKKVHATYDLTIIGDLSADEIEVNGELLVNGNIKAKSVRCLHFNCSGKVNVDNLQCDEEIIARNVSANIIQTQGSIVVTDSLSIDELCEAEGNVVAVEGISGQGVLNAEKIIAVDYFDFDGECETNVFEISTILGKSNVEETAKKIVDSESFSEKLDHLLHDFVCEVADKEEETILEEISSCAKKQKVSFDELYYLFNEIDRISYLNTIENYRDYLLIRYAEAIFPREFREYETISHVFTMMLADADVSEMEYSAKNLTELMMSLKVIVTIFEEDISEKADKVFSFIGLKYSFVNKLFER